jgi:L-xylulokinase
MRSPGAVLLGLDAGLTSTKAVVIDARGRSLAVARQSTTRLDGPDGACERDLEELWKACCAVILEAVARAGVTRDQVIGIAVSGHGDGLILVDDGGTPIRPSILSLDTRARTLVRELEMDGTNEAVSNETGRPLAAGRPLALLSWTLRNDPLALRRARWILFTKDWVRLRLTGQVSTDYSDAGSGLLSRSRLQYAESLLDSMGLGTVVPKLPEILPSVAMAGRLQTKAAEAMGLRAGTPVAAGSHDASASIVGSGAFATGTLCAIAGTWSIDVLAAEPRRALPCPTPHGIHTRWCLDGERSLLVSSSPSGIGLLETYRSLQPDDAPSLARGSSSAETGGETSEGLPIVVPSFRGVWPSHRPGAAVVGLVPHHGPAALAEATVQAMAHRHRLGYELLASQDEVRDVRVTGGISRSDAWAQLLADCLGREVGRTGNKEDGAAGAAAIAGVAVGMWDSLDKASAAVGAAARVFPSRPDRHDLLSTRYYEYRSTFETLATPC